MINVSVAAPYNTVSISETSLCYNHIWIFIILERLFVHAIHCEQSIPSRNLFAFLLSTFNPYFQLVL
jgi:hypothetical protein